MEISEFEVRKRIITNTHKGFFTGQKNVDTFHFEFDDEWENLDKTVILLVEEETYNVAMLNNEIVLPAEVYRTEKFVLGVFGTSENSILASNLITIRTIEGAYKEGREPTNLPTPTQWDLYVTAINDLLRQANIAKARCEEILAELTELYESMSNLAEQVSENVLVVNQKVEDVISAEERINQAKTAVLKAEENVIELSAEVIENAETATQKASEASASATSAQTSAITATEKASEAGTSANTATTKAGEASTSAQNAQTSATIAETFANNANSSASSASQSASSASTSAQSASTSASTAIQKASEASTSASSALESANTASTKATEASTSAQTASTKASEASESATIAGQAKDDTVVIKEELEEDLDELLYAKETLDNVTYKNKSEKAELVNIQDALKCKTFEMDVDGAVKQETTTGKQLFNANAIPTSTGIVIEDNGKTIKMPILDANGNRYTGKTLQQLCPNMEVGETYYLNFDRNYGNYNKFIYLISSVEIPWYVGENRTITESDLNSKVYLYGNRYMDGETNQIILSNFRITKNADDTFEPYTGGEPSPNKDYLQEIEMLKAPNLAEVTSKYNANYNAILDNGIVTIDGTSANAGGVSLYLNNYHPTATPSNGVNLKKGIAYKVTVFCEGTFNGSGYKVVYLNTSNGSIAAGNLIPNGKTIHSFTPNEDVILRAISLDFAANIVFENCKIKVLVQVDNNNVIGYVPRDHVKIKRIGKNYFNKNGLFDYGNLNFKTYVQADGTVKTTANYGGNRSAGQLFEHIEPNTNYTISGILLSADGNTNNNNVVVEILDTSNRNLLSRFINSSVTKPYNFSFTFNSGENTSFWLSLSGWAVPITKPTETIFDNIMLSKEGGKFEPYQEQEVLINLGNNFVGKIDENVKDLIWIDKDKNYGLVKNIRYLELAIADMNNSEEYPGWYNTLETRQLYNDHPNINSSMFSAGIVARSNISNETNGLLVNTNSYTGVLCLKSSNFGITQTEWKEQYPDLIFRMYYAIKEPEIITLGKLPEYFETVEGTNNIWVEANLSTKLEVIYAQDLNKKIASQELRINAIEELLSSTETSALLLDNLQSDLESEVM